LHYWNANFVLLELNADLHVIFTVKIWRYYTVIGGPNNRLTGNGKNRVGNTITGGPGIKFE
jgi:hypothetical protein